MENKLPANKITRSNTMKKLTAIMMTLTFALSVSLTAMPISAKTASVDEMRTGNNFLIPNNTLIEARLNQRLQAERLGDGTRFTMTVTSPRQFRGAVIEGYVEDARRSGRVSGRSEIVLNFNRIRHRGKVTILPELSRTCGRPEASA